MKTTRKAVGGDIDIDLASCKAIKATLRKARQPWRIQRGELFTNMALKNKTKLLLWNVIARGTLTYGIQTIELTEKGELRLDGSTFYFMRQIQDIRWFNKPQKPQCANLHITKTQTCANANQGKLEYP